MAERSLTAFPAARLEVRRVRADEYAALDALILEAYEYDYGPSTHSEETSRRSEVRERVYDVWSAHDRAGELVGSVTTRRPGGPPLHEDFGDDEFDLRLLAVAPTARRRGLAGLLMQHVIDEGRSGGWSAVTLKTAPYMTSAQRLYESLGFERAYENDGLWIGGVRQFDLFAYRLRLTS